jgi:hypothetical protein
MHQAHLLFGLGDRTQIEEQKVYKKKKRARGFILRFSGILDHLDPSPVASDLLMILSFLQVPLNILQTQKNKDRKSLLHRMISSSHSIEDE